MLRTIFLILILSGCFSKSFGETTNKINLLGTLAEITAEDEWERMKADLQKWSDPNLEKELSKGTRRFVTLSVRVDDLFGKSL